MVGGGWAASATRAAEAAAEIPEQSRRTVLMHGLDARTAAVRQLRARSGPCLVPHAQEHVRVQSDKGAGRRTCSASSGHRTGVEWTVRWTELRRRRYCRVLLMLPSLLLRLLRTWCCLQGWCWQRWCWQRWWLLPWLVLPSRGCCEGCEGCPALRAGGATPRVRSRPGTSAFRSRDSLTPRRDAVRGIERAQRACRWRRSS